MQRVPRAAIVGLLVAVMSTRAVAAKEGRPESPPSPLPASRPVEPLPALTLPASPPGYHTHDGFFFRGSLGYGWAGTHATTGGVEKTISGKTGLVSLAAGGSLNQHLVLYFALVVHSIFTPRIVVQNEVVQDFSHKLGIGGFGPGVAYYFTESNVFVSASVLLTNLTFPVGGNSDRGPGVSLHAGKEWWISADWGVGVGVEAMAARTGQSGYETPWLTTSLTAAASTTFN